MLLATNIIWINDEVNQKKLNNLDYDWFSTLFFYANFAFLFFWFSPCYLIIVYNS